MMKKKLECILLIDDNPNDNFFHERIIKKSACADEVVVCESAQEALSRIKAGAIAPDLIFLDVNMPGMNGWEFLDEYSKVDEQVRSGIIIIMLTSSTDAEERLGSYLSRGLTDFQLKPLARPKLDELLMKHFPECFSEV